MAAYDADEKGFRVPSHDRGNSARVAYNAGSVVILNESLSGIPAEDVRDNVNLYIPSAAHYQYLLNTSPSETMTTVRADDAEEGNSWFNVYDRWSVPPEEVVTVAGADDAEQGTFRLSPYDRRNTSVVAVDVKSRTYGLSPEEILSMVAFDAEGSTYVLLPEWGPTPVTRANDAEGSVYRYDLLPEDIREVAQAQIMANNENRTVAGVFYDSEGRHLWYTSGPFDACESC